MKRRMAPFMPTRGPRSEMHATDREVHGASGRWKERRENGLEWSPTTSSHTACAQGAAMPYGTPFLPPAGGANKGVFA